MLADFAVVPMGVTGGVKELVAEALKIANESGLCYDENFRCACRKCFELRALDAPPMQ